MNELKQFDVRPIMIEDVEGFHACIDTVAKAGRYLAAREALPIESAFEFVQNNINNNLPQFVALDGERVAGWCDISPRSRSMSHCGQLGMGVHPDYWGFKLGWKLLETTIKKANDTGLKKVELEVYTDNSRAISLYTKFGFVVEGIRQKSVFLDDAYHDLLCMGLWIGQD